MAERRMREEIRERVAREIATVQAQVNALDLNGIVTQAPGLPTGVLALTITGDDIVWLLEALDQ